MSEGSLCLDLQLTLASNYFGPVYLTSLLVDVLKASAPSRVVYEASLLEQWGKVDWSDIGSAACTAYLNCLCITPGGDECITVCWSDVSAQPHSMYTCCKCPVSVHVTCRCTGSWLPAYQQQHAQF